jgi:hypothetical protein
MEGRRIGIVHRVKRTKEGEARPTKVAIAVSAGKMENLELKTEQDELDLVLGFYPVSWRAVHRYDDISRLAEHHIRRDKITKNPKMIPKEFEGLKSGDTVLMIFGGSGDRLAYAAKRRLDEIGGRVLRITPFRLKEKRINEKEYDHELLIHLYEDEPELFQEMSDRDMDLIFVRETYFARQEAMKARIGCEQRLRQRFIGKIFLSKEGGFPEGNIEDEFDRVKASNSILNALIKEEKAREMEMKKAVRRLPVWENLFEQVEGVGEAIAARFISAIGDIRRFETKHKFKKYCGVHVLPDGRFARRRNNEIANWKDDARQALYLLGDQFNRRPNSIWGKKLREHKVHFRNVHPEPTKANGKTKYSDGHIHKMAIWRTLTKFTEWLFNEWTKVEKEKKQELKEAA